MPIRVSTEADKRRLDQPNIIKRGFLETFSAARFLDISPSYLRKLRYSGKGPAYCLFGRRVVYTPDDLNRWAMSFKIKPQSIMPSKP